MSVVEPQLRQRRPAQAPARVEGLQSSGHAAAPAEASAAAAEEEEGVLVEAEPGAASQEGVVSAALPYAVPVAHALAEQAAQRAALQFDTPSVYPSLYPSLNSHEVEEGVPSLLEPSAPVWSAGAGALVEPSAPELEAEDQPLLAASARNDAGLINQIRASIVVQPGQPRPLSPASAQRLEQLRARARMAEVQEEAEQAALKRRGEVVPSLPVTIIQHRVAPADDIVDLAVLYGTSVAAIRAANRRLVFEQSSSLENVRGEVIDIPATKGPGQPPLPARSAAEEEINRQHRMTRDFQSQTNTSSEEASFYLEDANWNMRIALEQWADDERFEKESHKQGTKMKALAGGGGHKGGGMRGSGQSRLFA